MVFKASTVIFVFLILGQIAAEKSLAQSYENKEKVSLVEIMEKSLRDSDDNDDSDDNYVVLSAVGEAQTEEECGCVDEENCLETVEVAIHCEDGECTATLLQDTDIDFNADIALTAIPVEDNSACCA